MSLILEFIQRLIYNAELEFLCCQTGNDILGESEVFISQRFPMRNFPFPNKLYWPFSVGGETMRESDSYGNLMSIK